MVRARFLLIIDTDDNVTLAKANYKPMDVDSEWRRLSPVLTRVVAPPPACVEDVEHNPGMPTIKAGMLPAHDRPVSSSSKVKVEDPDRRAGIVEHSKVVAEAFDKAPTLNLIKQSNSNEDLFLTSSRQTPNLTVGDRWLGQP
jgi:hypothetical protein